MVRAGKTDQAPGDATRTAAGQAYHSSENGGGIAGAEVLIQIAKYGIIVLAFVGEDNATARWCLPHPIVRV